MATGKTTRANSTLRRPKAQAEENRCGCLTLWPDSCRDPALSWRGGAKGRELGAVSEEAKRKFYQFPLALFAYGANQQEKLDGMTAFATISAGEHMERKLGGVNAAKEFIKNNFPDRRFSLQDSETRSWYLGRNMVSYSWHSNLKHCLRIYRAVCSFLSTFGPSPMVRVFTEIFQEVHKGQFEFRDFSVLCSVFAIIGDKEYAIVRRDRVLAGALGYSSAHVLFDEAGKITSSGGKILAARPDKAVPLSENQVRTTLNKLHARGFFSRLHPWPSARRTYYSRSLSHDELADRLVGRIERQMLNPGEQKKGQEAFRQKASALLKRLSSGAPIFSPESNQAITAGVTADSTAGTTGLICASSNACSSNSCSLNECATNGDQSALSGGEKKLKEKTGAEKTIHDGYEGVRAAVENDR
jgi:hypothetical protein